MLELEKTYLAKYLPADLETCPFEELLDIYFPLERAHPKLRLRQRGETYELTKKEPVLEGDASRQNEQTIKLTPDEWAVFKDLPGKRVHKVRYYYKMTGQTAEIDVFKEDLAGLILIDFEFATTDEQDTFQKPEWCLAEVTQEDFIAGGMICGKKYAELEKDLAKFNYHQLFL